MRPLRALLLSDGLPGHYHLAEGIVAAMARRREVQVSRLVVRRRAWLPSRALAGLLSSGIPAAAVLRWGYAVEATSLPSADVVVSAGGNTLAANVAAARLLSARNIFYGSLRRFRPEDFALVLTSHRKYAERPRHVVTLKPSALDPDSLKLHTPAESRAPRLAGLLVGGNTSTIRYEQADWDRLLDFVGALTARTGTRWIVSNSRRTPPSTTSAISRLANASGSPIEKFIDIASAGPGSLGVLLADAAVIFCTTDSSSMISEAVWARRPVIEIAPKTCVIPEAEFEYRNYLAASNWARTIPIADLTPERMNGALAEMTPLAGNPLDELASLLNRHLPGLLSD